MVRQGLVRTRMHHQQPGQNLPPSAPLAQRSPYVESQSRAHGIMQHNSQPQMPPNQSPMVPSAQHVPGMQKVHSWTQQHHFVDSGVQSMTPSTVSFLILIVVFRLELWRLANILHNLLDFLL